MTDFKPTIGIDASNLNYGGGKAHLIELLRFADPKKHNFQKIIVWSTQKTLDEIDDKAWIVKKSAFMRFENLIYRFFWQYFIFSKKAIKESCDIIFIPGGIYLGNFHPIITMCQNLLPFQKEECARYKITLQRLKLFFLRLIQKKSFKQADGVIFLHNYAKKIVKKSIGKLSGKTEIIPHGINSKVNLKKNRNYKKKKIRILYVSHIEVYKHQWNVIEAISMLRDKNNLITLDLVGTTGSAIKKLNDTIKKYDPDSQWVFYRNHIPYDKIHLVYQKFDYGIFASSCENLPGTLLEMIYSGMTIACSNYSPMPQILGNRGFYFDPLKSKSIASAIYKMVNVDAKKKNIISDKYFNKYRSLYNWRKNTDRTFYFLNKFAKNKKNNH